MLKELNALGKFEKPERDRILLTALKKYLDSPEGIELLEKYKKGKQK
ncbi:MAG: hypothetical protein HY097_03750 [Nitrospinae bacterium]|nr:hypothetical protein [Nitrospinota bacterium]